MSTENLITFEQLEQEAISHGFVLYQKAGKYYLDNNNGVEDECDTLTDVRRCLNAAIKMKDNERICVEHHISCYNRDKFEWEWRERDHIGVWLYGGRGKTPYDSWSMKIKIIMAAPKYERTPGWFVYIGPIPKVEYVSK
jgi:hypothetical protein